MAEPAGSSPDDRSRESAGNWAALFQHSSQAVFLLSRRRRFRYVNHNWEALTGQPSESMLGKISRARSTLEPDPAQRIANALLPPQEVFEGRSVTVRRPVPSQQTGPPWWDIAYLPLRGADGLLGVIGTITPVGEMHSTPTGKGLPAALVELRQKMASEYTFELLHSELPARQRIAEQARLAAKTRHPVWFIGPKGSGKETLARIIHNQGVTREQVFLAVDAAGLQPYFIRGMLFGKLGFAETGRIGTLFLQNAHKLPGDLQRELLHWLEQHPQPPRIIVSQTTPVAEQPACRRPVGPQPEKLADSDLLPEFTARLSVFEIRVLPLASAEMMAGFRGFVERIMVQEGFTTALHPDVWAEFQKYHWPENFHELRETIRACVSASGGKLIEIGHIPVKVREAVAQQSAGKRNPPPRKVISLEWVLEQVERRMILRAMKQSGVNRANLADRLGMARATLLRRLKALGIAPE